jgi:hypothetical protein
MKNTQPASAALSVFFSVLKSADLGELAARANLFTMNFAAKNSKLKHLAYLCPTKKSGRNLENIKL